MLGRTSLIRRSPATVSLDTAVDSGHPAYYIHPCLHTLAPNESSNQHFLFVAGLSLLTVTCFAQVNNNPSDANPSPDYAGRSVEIVGSSAPPAIPVISAPQRESFEQSVKDIYFDFARHNLTSDDQATLQQDADWLKAHPDVMFTIEGDADPRGEIVYNLYLSDARALAARDELLKLGVPDKQIAFAQGWGKLYPVCQQEDESCWSQERRAHFAPWTPNDVPGMAVAAPSTAAALSPQ